MASLRERLDKMKRAGEGRKTASPAASSAAQPQGTIQDRLARMASTSQTNEAYTKQIRQERKKTEARNRTAEKQTSLSSHAALLASNPSPTAGRAMLGVRDTKRRTSPVTQSVTPTGRNEVEDLRAEVRQRSQLANGVTPQQLESLQQTREERQRASDQRMLQEMKQAEKSARFQSRALTSPEAETIPGGQNYVKRGRELESQADALSRARMEADSRNYEQDREAAIALMEQYLATDELAKAGLAYSSNGPRVPKSQRESAAMAALSVLQRTANGDIQASKENTGLEYLTEEEKNRFLSMIANDEWEKAGEYIQLLQRDLNAREMETFKEETLGFSQEHPFLGAAANVGYGFAQPLAYLENLKQAAQNAATGEYVPTDINSPMFRGAQGSAATAHGVHAAAERAGGPVAGFLADTGLSIANMASKMPLGPVGSLAYIGAVAAGGNTLDTLENGGRPEQAAISATAAGAIEILTEKMPLEELFRMAKTSPVSVKQVVTSILKQMGTEATEEAVSEVANNIVDHAVMGNQSEYEQYVQALIQSGVSETEARKEATRQFYLENVGLAALGGALASGIMAGGAQAIGGFRGGPVQSDVDQMVDADIYGDLAATQTETTGRELFALEMKEPVYAPAEQEPVVPPVVSRALGKQGEAIAQEMYQDANQDPAEYFEGFTDYYQAGISGRDIEKVSGAFADTLTEPQKQAAYLAGQVDAAASLAQEKERARFANTAGKDSGLVYDDYVKDGVQSGQKEIYDQINTLAKALGTRVRFVDSVFGGQSNAEINIQNEGGGDEILIERDNPNPVRAILGHEFTHRVQQLAPEEYRAFRDYVGQDGASASAVNAMMDLYQKRGLEISYEGALDEVAADYAGQLFENSKTLDRFIQDNMENRSLLEKVRDFFRSIVNKLTGKERDQATEAERKLTQALKAATGQAEALQKDSTKNAATKGGETKLSLKDARESYAGKSLTEDGKVYSYDFLTSLPDMKVTTLPNVDTVRDNGQRVDTKAVVMQGMKNARTVGTERGGKVFVRNDYTGRQLLITSDSIRHGLNGGLNRLLTNARLGAVIGDVVQNAVPINSLHNQAEGVTGTYAMAGYATDARGREFVAIITVEQYDGNVAGIEVYDVTHAVSGRQKNSSQADTKSQGFYPIKAAEISIADFLDVVNTTHQSILSDDVLSHFGETRNEDGDYAGKVKFSLKEYTDEEKQAHVKTALEHFGRTFSWKETGYLTPDGKKIDFSGKHDGAPGGYRTVDHRDISEALGLDYGGEDYSGAMTQFMAEGNIRISPESNGINLSIHPTKAQMEALEDFISKARGEVILDIDAPDGDTVISMEYPKGTRASKVLADISRYFETGETPQVSDVERFRFSLKGEEELLKEIRALVKQAQKEGWSDAQLREARLEAVERVYQSLLTEYGSIPAGENPARQVQVPRQTSEDKKVSQTVRTILEAKATPEEAIPTIQEMVAKGEFSYETITDKAAVERAESTITDKSWGNALADWKKDMAAGKVTKNNTALGWALYNYAANRGDLDTAMGILNDMVKNQRNAAQALQATRILKKLSPESQLYGVVQSVEGLQKELNERYGEKDAPELKIPQELGEKLLKAKTQAERDEALRDIYRDIGRQMPSRFRDKWNAWRYLSMLGNPRTHVRNVFGNAGFAPVVAVKDLTATGIEKAVSAVTGGNLQRSKGLVGFGKNDRALLSAAWADYANVEEAALGGGKYSDLQNANKYIEEGRVIFQGKAGKALEAARKANSKALDVEDAWFSQPHYAYALAQFCKAHKITEAEIRKGNDQVLAAARNYAIREAQKATYRDTNALSQTVSRLGRDVTNGKNSVSKGLGTLAEGILPFRKTPANILARGLEYSPIGLAKGLSYDLAQVKKGNMTGAEAIDNISAGLTGTGLFSLGVYLAAQGLVRGKGEGDDKEREMEKLQGHQDYALDLPDGTSITLDWLAPEALPFFVGVNLWETAQSGDGNVTLSQMLEAAGNVSEPMLEMSCLQSLNDVLEAGSKITSQGLGALPSALASAATSYLTQGLPTVFGQLERTAEEERETTYTEKNAFLTPDMQYTLGKVSGKIPVLEYQQIPYIDAWGRHESSGNAGQRAFNNLLNPAYTSKAEESPMEEELLRLYRQTGETGVFPKRAPKYFNVNGERKDLTAEEYVRYAEKRGQTSLQVVTDITENKFYIDLEEGEKAEAVEDAYTYANQVARNSIDSGANVDSWVTKAQEGEKKYKLPVATYIILRNSTKDIEGLKNEDGDTITNSKGLRIMQRIYGFNGLNDAQRKYLFACFGVGEKVIGYNKSAVNEALKKMEKE